MEREITPEEFRTMLSKEQQAAWQAWVDAPWPSMRWMGAEEIDAFVADRSRRCQRLMDDMRKTVAAARGHRDIASMGSGGT